MGADNSPEATISLKRRPAAAPPPYPRQQIRARGPRGRPPPERPLALAEHRTNERRHEARVGERGREPPFLRAGAQVVAVVEHDGAFRLGPDHRPALPGHPPEGPGPELPR